MIYGYARVSTRCAGSHWVPRDSRSSGDRRRDAARGADIQSPAKPLLGITSEFAEIVFAILGVAVRLERRRILERPTRGGTGVKAEGLRPGREQQWEALEPSVRAKRNGARSYSVSHATISRLTT
jgi:hypothetical protein